MGRSIWTGSISFGLVNIPVKVHSAIRKHNVRFHQLSEKTGNRVRNKRVDEQTGREVDYDDIVKGFEVSKDHYVEVTQDEIEAMKPESTKTIDIEDFVELAAIDPIYYERTYFLAPQDNEGARKAYGLLLRAMEDKGKVGIGRVVLREKQYLAAIRPFAPGALALSTMLFADEVVDVKDIDNLPVRGAKVTDGERKMAGQLIDSLDSEWNPKKYKDTYEVDLKKLIKAKEQGKEIVVAERPDEPEADVADLMAALEASLKSGSRSKSTTSAKSTKATKKRSTRRKSAA
jgi:DNA end-binding protein Ku